MTAVNSFLYMHLQIISAHCNFILCPSSTLQFIFPPLRNKMSEHNTAARQAEQLSTVDAKKQRVNDK